METRLTLGRSAAIRFLDGLRDEDVAAVYNFDIKVQQMQDFSPGRDLPSSEFAATFPISNDQSIVPAAGDGAGGTPASGANFTSVGVDPLAIPNPLPLLPPEDRSRFQGFRVGGGSKQAN